MTLMNPRILVAALLLAPLPAHALGAGEFVDGLNFEVLQGIQAQIRQVIQEPQNRRQIPLVVPVVDFGDKRAARYRYRGRTKSSPWTAPSAPSPSAGSCRTWSRPPAAKSSA